MCPRFTAGACRAGLISALTMAWTLVAMSAARAGQDARPSRPALPTITGHPEYRQTLKALPGTRSGRERVSTTFQWQRCRDPAAGPVRCTDIARATGPTYTLTAADAGSPM